VLGPNDFVLLTAADSLASGYGLPADPIFSSFPNAGKPLGNQFILDSAEVAAARNATSAFNAIIRSHADANTAVVDVFAIFNEISAKGLTIAGQTFSTAYISGGLFTLDGVHPTSQAHGIIANEFIRTINAKWGASIPFVNVLSLPGLPIPLSKQQASWRLQDIPANAIREAAKIWR
jgi:phospholipase/lecithinase/hemolysin